MTQSLQRSKGVTIEWTIMREITERRKWLNKGERVDPQRILVKGLFGEHQFRNRVPDKDPLGIGPVIAKDYEG